MVFNEEHELDDLPLSSDDQDVMSSSSDWTTNRYDAGSSGYESMLNAFICMFWVEGGGV